MWYLIESGFECHIILCDATCSYYEQKNHTKYRKLQILSNKSASAGSPISS